MSFDTKRLYELLPAIYRIRDAEQGEPLRALLDIIAGQAAVLEDNLDQLYDDQFVETCADWVVPYIGDLVAARALHHEAPAMGSPRAMVANTIAYRRRKGTAAMLEQLAVDVTGWHSKAVEFFQLLATTQFMNHVRPRNMFAPDLRHWRQLENIDAPFDEVSHTVDTRHIANREGKYNIPNIGIFLWRLGAYRLGRSPAFRVSAKRYRFSPLGHDLPLFLHPQPEDALTRRATPLTVPDPISRRKMDAVLGDYYGVDRSIYIEGVPPENVVVCDLSAWGTFHGPPAGRVGIDPVLGRILFAAAPQTPPLVTFHHGFSADLGGGEYERADSFQMPAQPFDQVAAPALLQPALSAATRGAVIQISDNARYEEALSLAVKVGERIELRAANEQRPTLVLPGDFVISGGDENAEVTLNGLLITGGTLQVTAKLARLRLRHCTLVPGLALGEDGTPQHGDAPGLVVGTDVGTVEIEDCILGGIRAETETEVKLRNCILDATRATGIAFAAAANAPATSQPAAGGTLSVENCTVIGRVRARYLELASNSIFVAEPVKQDPWPAPVFIERRQTGCVRFSWLPYGSLTPRRYRCQPELEVATQIAAADAESRKKFGLPLSNAERDSIRQTVLPWLKPSFTSRHYGKPAYGQLRLRAPEQIRQGADDESEMGAFHDLFAPQREINLRVRLDEYLRFTLSAGILYVT
jgi:hypothetical protein